MNAGTLLIVFGAIMMMQPLYHRSAIATQEARQKLGGVFNYTFKPSNDHSPDLSATIARLNDK